MIFLNVGLVKEGDMVFYLQADGEWSKYRVFETRVENVPSDTVYATVNDQVKIDLRK